MDIMEYTAIVGVTNKSGHNFIHSIAFLDTRGTNDLEYTPEDLCYDISRSPNFFRSKIIVVVKKESRGRDELFRYTNF